MFGKLIDNVLLWGEMILQNNTYKFQYNQRLFHLHDSGITDDYEIMVRRFENAGLGKTQVDISARKLMNFFVGFSLFSIGVIAILVKVIPDPYRRALKHEMLSNVVIIGTGVVLCLLGIMFFSCIGDKIILYERGMISISCFGLRKQRIMYSEIENIVKCQRKIKGNQVTQYILYANGKKYFWSGSDFHMLEQIMDMLILKCFTVKNLR